MKKIKTNAMRLLEEKNIPCTLLSFSLKDEVTPEHIAKETGRELDIIFKTLITKGQSGEHYIFCLQLTEELDLKKAARAAGEKSISLIDLSDLLKVTGYERGGVSPLGMKKKYRTFFDEKAAHYDKIVVSAGKRGFQIEVSPHDLITVTEGAFHDLLMETRSIF